MKKIMVVQAGLIGLLFTIIFILPFTAVVYKLTAQIHQEITINQEKIQGLEYNSLLRKVLEDVQQHREIAYVYLSGESAFKDRLTFKQSHIENHIQLIDEVNRKFGAKLHTSEKWQTLKAKWKSLKSQALTQTPQESFQAHTALIADLLSLSLYVGDTSNLILNPVLDSYYLMDAIVTKLPSAIENTAQLRDLGADVILRKRINADEKAQLIVLCSLLQSSTDLVARGTQVAFHQNSQLSPKLEVYVQDSLNARNEFLKLLNQEILNSPAINLPKFEYFASGTRAIGTYFKLYDALSPALDELLRERINHLSRKKEFIELFALLSLALVIYALVAFARNLTKRKRAEQEVSLLQTLSQAISESQDFHSALEVALRKVCQVTGWDYGEAWVPSLDGTLLKCSPAWYTSDSRLEKFRELSETGTFPANIGLPGRVWSSKQPEWIQDVSIAPETVFLADQVALKAGLKAGLGLPIIGSVAPPVAGTGEAEAAGEAQEKISSMNATWYETEPKVLAVLVFYTLTSHQEDRRMVELVSAVAAQLGSVLGRKAAEEALRLAEEKYRKIFENATQGIYQTTPEGRYLSANPALARLYGYASPEEMIAEVSNIATQVYTNPKRRDQFIATIEKHDSVSRFKSQVYRKDGSIIWISESARAVRDANGKLLYYEGTVEDITARKVAEEALRYQQEQSELLLLNILPGPIAARLRLQERTIADSFSEVTVLFADIVGFTELSADIPAVELVEMLNEIFSAFDQLADHYQLEKIKTIGDAYMVVGGLPLPQHDHAEKIAEMALDILQAIQEFSISTSQPFSIRIGINTGPVVAGVIGIKKFTYDLWGDTVNTASRMESQGIPGCIQVTAETYERLRDKYIFEERGIIQVRGKGEMMTYLLKGRKIDDSISSE